MDAALAAIEHEADVVLMHPDLAFTAMCRIAAVVRSLRKTTAKPPLKFARKRKAPARSLRRSIA